MKILQQQFTGKFQCNWGSHHSATRCGVSQGVPACPLDASFDQSRGEHMIDKALPVPGLQAILRTWKDPWRLKNRIHRAQQSQCTLTQWHMASLSALGQRNRQDAGFKAHLVPPKAKLLRPPQAPVSMAKAIAHVSFLLSQGSCRLAIGYTGYTCRCA